MGLETAMGWDEVRSGGLISPLALMELLARGTVPIAIVDCRFALGEPTAGRRQYGAGHVPGAVYFDLNGDLSDPVGPVGGRHPLPDRDRLATTLGMAGIGSGGGDEPPTLVVAYDDSRFAFASRLWWLLKGYGGHDRVVLLDGGWSAWVAAGGAIETASAAPTPRSFVPRPMGDRWLSFEAVRDSLGDPAVVLVDSRSPERYRGEVEPIDPVAGHVPGAINYFWQGVTDETGRARSPGQLREWFASGQGDLVAAAAADHAIVVYCGSGVTACVNLWALERAGIDGAKLYGGSWSDWCAHLPIAAVATGSAP